MHDRARLRRPAPPLVRRRLLQRLAGEWKVALFTAPAGYGKTTLAAQYAAHRATLWCRLDREDRELAFLFGHLLASGLRLDPPLTRRTERLFLARRDMERDGGLLTASLLSELIPTRGSLLVILEDLHVLTGAREACGWLRRLLEETGPGVRFLLTGRGACPLPLSRFELQGGVVRIGPEELEFDQKEQADFLRRAFGRAAHDDARIAAFRGSLGGWPAGLALLVGAGGGPTLPRIDGEHEARIGPLFRYLAEEVFAPLTAELQSALCRASLLEELEPAATEFLLGKRASANLAQELTRRELLVRELPDRPVHAFHPLFREFLKERRAELLPKAEVRALGRRLAAHLARRGEVARAIRVHMETEDPARAIALFEREVARSDPRPASAQLIPAALEMLQHPSTSQLAQRSPALLSTAAAGAHREGRFTETSDLVEKAGALWLARRAYLDIARDARLAAACAWVTGRVRPLLARMEALLARCPKRERMARAILSAEIGGLRLLSGHPARARLDLEKAERALRGTPHERQLTEIRVQGANVIYSEGRWDRYLEIAQDALAFYRRIGVPGRMQALLINMAEAHTYLGEEDRALSLLDEAESLQSLVLQQNTGIIQLGRARALVERGDYEAAGRSLDAARETAERQSSRLWALQVDLWSGVARRRQGQLDAARKLLVIAAEGFREIDAPAWGNVAAMELALVLGLKRKREALSILEQAARASRRLGDAKEEARNLLYQARVRLALRENAGPTLRRAMRLLERERYLVLLRKEADVARDLLLSTDALPARLRSIALAALPDINASGQASARVDVSTGTRGIVVQLLGGLEVTVGGDRAAFLRRASAELFARLALRLGEPLRREDLAEALWPGAPAAKSRNRFDVALNGVRHLLEPGAGPRGPFHVLESSSGWCRLLASAVEVDVVEFEAAAQKCEPLLRELLATRADESERRGSRKARASLESTERELARAAALYRGDLLPELIHAEWTQRERERLRGRAHRLLLGHAAACLRLGKVDAAEVAARRVLDSDPLDDAAERTLLSALAANGDHLAVVRSYRGFARRVLRELGAPASPETTALFQASLRAARR